MLPFTLVKKAAIFHLAIYGHFQIKFGTSDSRFYKLTWTMALKLRVLEISQLNFGKSFIFRQNLSLGLVSVHTLSEVLDFLRNLSD